MKSYIKKLICIILSISLCFGVMTVISYADNVLFGEETVFDNADSAVFLDMGSGELVTGGQSGTFVKTTKARYYPKITTDGVYKLYVYNPETDYEANGTLISVKDALETTLNTADFANDRANEWIEIGLFEFSSMQEAEIIIKSADDGVIKADAIKFVYVSDDYTFDPNNIGGKDFLKDSEDYKDYYSVLLSLGVYDKVTDNYKAEASITRAQAARAVARMLGAKGEDAKNSVYFTDVPIEHEFCSYINILAQGGIVAGNGNGVFRPDDNVKFEELVLILLRSLGYDYDGFLPRFEENYYNQARKLGLLDGVSSNQGDLITAAEMTCMIYNALDIDLMEIISISDDSSEYATSSGINVLNVYLNAIKGKGVITDNGFTALSGDSNIDIGQIVINGQIFSSPYDMSGELIGQHVEYYATDEEKSEILYLFATGQSEIVTIAAKNLDVNNGSFSRNNIVYFDSNERVRNVSVPLSAYVIYNGRALLSYTVDDFKIQEGMITCISSVGNGVDVVIVKDVDYYVVERTYPALNKLLALNSKIPFEFDSEKTDYKSVILNSEGLVISVAEMQSGNVFAYMQSKGANPVKTAYLLDVKPINDVVSGIYNDGIAFGGGKYAFSSSYTAVPILAGNNVSAYLTWDNQIFYVENKGIANEAYGYFIAMSKPDGAFEATAQIKLLTTNGKVEYVNVNEKINYNGDRVSVSDLYAKLASKPQLIKYRLNSDSEISLIKTAVDRRSGYPDGVKYDLNEFAMEFKDGQGLYVGGCNSFDTMHSLTASTLVFQVAPVDGSHFGDEDYYGVKTHSVFKHYEKYSVEVYDYDDIYNIGAVVYYSDLAAQATELKETTSPLIVTGVSQTMDSDGGIISVLDGYQDGQEVSFPFDPNDEIYSTGGFGAMNAYPDMNTATETYENVTVSDLGFGDIVQIATDAKGHIAAMRVFLHNKIHDKGIMGENMYIDGTHPMNKNTCYSLFYVGHGKVTDIIGNWVYYETKAPAGSGDSVWSRKCSLAANQYYFMNREREAVTPTTADSLCVGDEIILRCHYGTPQEVIILEN